MNFTKFRLTLIGQAELCWFIHILAMGAIFPFVMEAEPGLHRGEERGYLPNDEGVINFIDSFEEPLEFCDGGCRWKWDQGGRDCEVSNQDPVQEGEYGAPSPRAGNAMLRTRTFAGITSCVGISKPRSELLRDMDLPPDSERWIGFSTYIPSENGIPDDAWVAIMQLHYGAVRPRPGHELFYLEVGNGGYNLLYSRPPGCDEISEDCRARRILSPITDIVLTDRWTDWVFHIKMARKSSRDKGFIRVYMDGRLVFNEVGPFLRDWVEISPDFKIGQYPHKGWPKSNPDEMIIYHDEIRIGSEQASFSDVAPLGWNWEGYPVTTDREGRLWADTADWLGWVIVDSRPLFYLQELPGWIYIMDGLLDSGAWCWFYQ